MNLMDNVKSKKEVCLYKILDFLNLVFDCLSKLHVPVWADSENGVNSETRLVEGS